jgi:hypothetical protein
MNSAERKHQLRLVRTPTPEQVRDDLALAVEGGDLKIDTAVFALNAFKASRGLPLYHGPDQQSYTPPQPPDTAA